MAGDLLGSCLCDLLGAGIFVAANKLQKNKKEQVALKVAHLNLLYAVLGCTVLTITAFPLAEVIIGKWATDSFKSVYEWDVLTF